MADILFQCPNCTKTLAVDVAHTGKTVACTDCKAPVVIPEPDFGFECFHCKHELQTLEKYSGQKVTCSNCNKEVVIPTSVLPEQDAGRVSTVSAQTTCSKCGAKIVRIVLYGIIPLLIVFCGSYWTYQKQMDATKKEDTLKRVNAIQLAFNSITSRVSHSSADIQQVISEMDTLVQRASQSELPEWSVKSKDYAEMMRRKDVELTAVVINLSNMVYAVETKDGNRAAVKILREYSGPFVAETEKFRNDQINIYEAKIRKEKELEQVAQNNREVQEKQAALQLDTEVSIVQKYDRIRSESLRAFESPVGKRVKIQLISGTILEGIVQVITDDEITVAKTNSAVSITVYKKQIPGNLRLNLFASDYAENRVAEVRLLNQKKDTAAVDSAMESARSAGYTEDVSKAIETAITLNPEASNLQVAKSMIDDIKQQQATLIEQSKRKEATEKKAAIKLAAKKEAERVEAEKRILSENESQRRLQSELAAVTSGEKIEISETFKSTMRELISLCGEIDAQTDAGVNRRDFSLSVAKMKAKAEICFSIWPTGVLSETKMELRQAIRGWDIVLILWNREGSFSFSSSDPLLKSLKEYGVEEFTKNGSDVKIELSEILSIAAKHYDRAKSVLIPVVYK